MTTNSASPTPRKGRRWALGCGLVSVAGLVVLGLAAVHYVGPMFGFYPFPVSQQQFVEMALARMDGGLYADSDEWRAERARVLGATKGKDWGAVDEALKKAAKVAGGKHSFYLSPQEVKDAEASFKTENKDPQVSTAGRVTTLVVPEFGGTEASQMQHYADVLAHGIRDAAPQSCGWVVDLRGNGGGNFQPMLSGLAPLLPNGKAVTLQNPAAGTGFEVTIQDDGAGASGQTRLAIDFKQKIRQPIAVLYDDKTASSAELVATAFRGVDRVRSFGSATAGYTSSNSTIKLPRGSQLYLTDARYVDRNGVDSQEKPWQPDEPTGDAPRAAAAWLASQGCS